MSQMIESFMNAPAATSLSARSLELEEAAAAAGTGPALLRLPNPLHAVKVHLQVCVGEAEMTVGELMAARESEVLVLDRTTEQAVDLMLEGRVVARGQLVAVDGAFAVRITELPIPLRL